MNRGDIFAARLDPVEGSEQAGTRPVIVVSRDAINRSNPVVVIIPCTTFHQGRRIYPREVLLRAPQGDRLLGVALVDIYSCAKARPFRFWWHLKRIGAQRRDRRSIPTLRGVLGLRPTAN